MSRAPRREGYRARAAYKLIEIDDRFRFLKPGQRVVDLGAAPGGWSQVAAARVGSTPDDPRVVAIDYLDMDPIPGVTILMQDFLDEDAPEALRAALGGPRRYRPVRHGGADHRPPRDRPSAHVGLCEAAAEFARETLAPGGIFVAKVFRGGTEHTLLAKLKRDFAKVQHVKPPASRADCVELYLYASNYRGPEN